MKKALLAIRRTEERYTKGEATQKVIHRRNEYSLR